LVERIRITPSQVVTRDASNNITFNTDYSYLKTGSGTLYVGGYQRAPCIFGQNTITDHTAPTEGWFTPYVYNESNSFDGTQTRTFWYEVPKATYYRWGLGRPYSNYIGGYQSLFYGAAVRYGTYYNYDTNQESQLGSVRYQWAAGLFGFGDDGEGGYSTVKWCAWPQFVYDDISSQVPQNPSGGAIGVVYYADEYRDFARTMPSYNDYGQITGYYQQYGRDYYATRTAIDGYGYTYTIAASPMYIRKNSIYTTRNPIALSLSVTP
jgi:hypothetical protein